MKTIDQTRLYDSSNQSPPGNCFQACVATILGISLADVPDEADHWRPGMDPYKAWRAYWPHFCDWLRERELGYIEIQAHTGDRSSSLDVPCIASGPSPRDPSILHAVVIRYVRLDRHTIGPHWLHDPHPSRAWLRGRQIKRLGYFCGIPDGKSGG